MTIIKKLGKDLKVGDVVQNVGLITTIDYTSDHEIWESPNFTFICNYTGQGYSRAFCLDVEYDVIVDKKIICDQIRETIKNVNLYKEMLETNSRLLMEKYNESCSRQ
jgi:hypothetical protein